MRKHLMTLLAALLVAGGASYALASVSTSAAPAESSEVFLAQAEEDGADGEQAEGPKGRRGRGGPLKHAIRGELVVPDRENEGEFKTINTDRGVLQAIDGSTLTIEAADGVVVEITVDDDTTIKRDGEDATLGDLEVGDHVFVHRVDGVTERVKAISEERFAERQERRDERRAAQEGEAA